MALLEEMVKTGMSIAGRLSRLKQISGYTLIELIVVITIISLLLMFSFPMFKKTTLFSPSNADAGDLVRLISDLKKRAVRLSIDFTLNIDTTSENIWVTDSTMDSAEMMTAKRKGAKLSTQIEILDVEYKGDIENQAMEYKIKFSKQGYCDFALIHIKEDHIYKTIVLEPFLSQVQLLKTIDLSHGCN